ncbi:MAG: response regulator, partial [Gammaproteobacteria bacterium]|nr:response regulator [Gammaproteobacteria bacterium]
EPHLHGGLDWLRDYTPDLVLLDLNLPDSRGLSGIQRMRDAAPGVPIIVLTNVEDEATALHALRVGAEDYLHKRQLAPELLVRAMRYAVERARVDEALRESEERFALALSGANDGIWDWDIRRNRVYFSARCRAILDLPDEEESSMQAWFRRVHPDDLDALKSAMDGHLQGLDSHFENEHRVRRRDGEPVWVQS